MSDKKDTTVGRREFIGTAAAASAMIIKPELVWGTERNSAVRLGLLGCGGRGARPALQSRPPRRQAHHRMGRGSRALLEAPPARRPRRTRLSGRGVS